MVNYVPFSPESKAAQVGGGWFERSSDNTPHPPSSPELTPEKLRWEQQRLIDENPDRNNEDWFTEYAKLRKDPKNPNKDPMNLIEKLINRAADDADNLMQERLVQQLSNINGISIDEAKTIDKNAKINNIKSVTITKPVQIRDTNINIGDQPIYVKDNITYGYTLVKLEQGGKQYWIDSDNLDLEKMDGEVEEAGGEEAVDANKEARMKKRKMRNQEAIERREGVKTRSDERKKKFEGMDTKSVVGGKRKKSRRKKSRKSKRRKSNKRKSRKSRKSNKRKSNKRR